MERKYLLGALEYTEKLLSLGEKTVLDIQANSIACFLESDFVGKEGVSVNTDNGDVWLRMKRLRETTAPKSHPMFDGWVSGASNNPEKPPQLNSERLVRLSKEEISELIAADRLSGDDVMKPLKDDATGGSPFLYAAQFTPRPRVERLGQGDRPGAPLAGNARKW